MATAQQVAETKQMVRQAMQEEGVSPQTLISIGQLAERVLQDKSLYPQLLQAIIDSDLAEAEDLEADIDYELIGVFATLGKMAQEMIDSGELGA
jgi:hypothetical protein